MTETLRGCAMMVFSMACFAVEDALIKALTGAVPPTQIIWMLGLGGAAAFAIWLQATGRGAWSADYLSGPVLRRSSFEVVGALSFVSALALIPLTVASAVIQATPLVVAMGAAIFLGARVGPRRWAAILVGFGGVLLILRPWGTGFDPAVLLAVLGMLALAGRDLATRTMPASITGAHLSLHAFAALVPAGVVLQVIQGAPVVALEAGQAAILVLCVGIGMAGYLSVVAATRLGDLSVVSSFRYSRMLFALIIGLLFFAESPDAATLIGAGVVIASGLYTLVREARLARIEATASGSLSKAPAPR
ncbi:MAG: DMT family transporter [Pseudomonadota bacterium]